MYNKAINNEKGVALILVAVSIVVIFGLGALAIDVGHLYNVKNQLQAAADAAALAGASEMEGATYALMQQSAYNAADRIAQRNTADVSAQDGRPIPVTLTQDAVILGTWSGDTFTPSTDPAAINAVKVNANRGGSSGQPPVNNWFAKVFSLLPLGNKFDASAVGAVAVAAKEQNLRFVPIAVNEYWLSDDTKAMIRPYDDSLHKYPSSFVRQYQVNYRGQPQNVPSPAFGSTFAIIGSNADNNGGASSPNGYLQMDIRSNTFFGGVYDPTTGVFTKQIYEAINGSGGCSSCNSYFNGPSTTDPFNDSQKNATGQYTGINYLIHGYPVGKRLLPNAVYETRRATDALYADNSFASVTSAYGFNRLSECPYATVHYFQTSGVTPLNYSDGSSKNVADYFVEGDVIICMVYDGTMASVKNIAFNPVNQLATVVGYVPIEIDGYSGKNPKGIGLQPGNSTTAWAANKSVLSPSWSIAAGNPNTMYGHALSDIIQPDPSSPSGGCDFVMALRETAKKFNKSKVRLVGPNLKYGMVKHLN